MDVVKNCTFCKFVNYENDGSCRFGRDVNLMTAETSLQCEVDWRPGTPDCENCKHLLIDCQDGDICLNWVLRDMEQWLASIA